MRIDSSMAHTPWLPHENLWDNHEKLGEWTLNSSTKRRAPAHALLVADTRIPNMRLKGLLQAAIMKRG